MLPSGVPGRMGLEAADDGEWPHAGNRLIEIARDAKVGAV